MLAVETNLTSQESGRPMRRQFTSQQIDGYLQAQPASGLTIAAFCQQHGLHPSVFHGWKRRRRPPGGLTATFQEVVLPARIAPVWVAELALPTGPLLRWSAQADLARLAPLVAQLLRS